MAQDSPSTKFLYDFVYLDRDRLASLSAQIFKNGTLIGIKTEEKTRDHIGSDMAAGLKPFFSAVEKEQLTNLRGVERQFDAGWALPLNVLHRLNELGYIKKALPEAAIGDLVLMTGAINLIDLGIMKDLWEPIVEIQQANAALATKAVAKPRVASHEKHISKQIVAILKALPHSIQLRVFDGSDQAWASLRREYLTVNPEDFPLKHGPSIQGDWHCLAILDGKPNGADEELNTPNGASDVEQVMWEMSLQLRVLFGRRMHDYGLTPIAIFRSATGKGTSGSR